MIFNLINDEQTTAIEAIRHPFFERGHKNNYPKITQQEQLLQIAIQIKVLKV